MPFLALKDGKQVTPEEIPDGEAVRCPICSEPMRPRRSHYRSGYFVARHFWHYSRTSCAGESPMHQKMKSIVLSKLKMKFDYSQAGVERKIGANIADVYITFSEPTMPYGKGIAIEIQHRNVRKDKESATDNYLSEGYSVGWLDEGNFSDMNVDLNDNITYVWPNAVPHHEGGSYPNISKYGSRGVVRMRRPWFLLVPSREEWKAEPVDTTDLGRTPNFYLVLHWERGEFYVTVEPEARTFFMGSAVMWPTDADIESWIIEFLMSNPESDFFDGIGPKFSVHFPAKSFKDLKDKLIEMKDRGIVNEHGKKWSLNSSIKTMG